ncbi:MAG: Fe-S cluster assembly protein SufD [Phycisphaerales bacterium]|nr:MAG: Fe-S cluster assembly protein SufD [Phycisphaerales bacterium]
MTNLTETRMMQLSDLSSVEPTPADRAPTWLRELAQRAIARFSEMGLPTTRDEEWRLTNIKPIASTNFRVPEELPANINAKDLERFDMPGLEGPKLVFINGLFAPNLSEIGALPDGVRLMPLTEAFNELSDELELHLGRYADIEKDAFTALNTGSFREGVFVHVPKGTKLDKPIRILNVSDARSEPIITNPRNLIVGGDECEFTVIEDYVSTGQDVHFTNAVTEVVVGKRANVSHYLIERESEKAFNISTLQIQQEEESNFASHTVLLGGALVRNNVRPVLNGERCDSLLNGLYLPAKKQHMDNHMLVHHARPNCDSRQFYIGVLDDDATAVFSGRIIVDQISQKTDAKQHSGNLLLTDRARVNTHPQLEIYADDVKCTHGATIGQLDEDAIFYLRSRGLSKEAARGMLIHAFAMESLERMQIAPVKDFIEQELLMRLPDGKRVKKML